MSQHDRSLEPKRVEPIPYAGIGTGQDVLLEGSVSRAVVFGGTILRLIGAYSLVECRQPLVHTVENGLKWVSYFGTFDSGMVWGLVVIAAYLAWGLLLLLRGPRLIGFSMLRAASPSMAAGAEWSVVALTAAGAIVILWTMPPLLDISFTRWTFLPTLGQLGLGAWLFLAAGRLSSVRSLSVRG